MRLTTAIIFVVLAVASHTGLSAKKIKTTRSRLVTEKTATDSLANTHHKIMTCDSAVALYGFDKPLQSLYESVFARNLTDSTICCVYLTIEYIDRKERQLHKRQCRVKTLIPPGETRLLRFPSWDRQNSFYYEKSRRPRVEATRFNDICNIDSVEID